MRRTPEGSAKRTLLDRLIGAVPDPLRTYEEYLRATSQDLPGLSKDELQQEAARARLWLLVAGGGDPADDQVWWEERIRRVELELGRRKR